MGRLAANKYRFLFLTLILLIILFPILRRTPEARILLDGVFVFVFVVVLWVLCRERRHRVIAAALGIPTILGFASGSLLPGEPLLAAGITQHLLAALYFTFTITVILREIHREEGVTADCIFGAFCGYLLSGLAFGHVFTILELVEPGSYAGDGWNHQSPVHHHFVLTYFSFLTLTTVGYGDVIPRSDLARGLAVVEAIVGQFYLAVLVAELIGKRIQAGELRRD